MQLRYQHMTLAQCCKPKPGDEIIGRPRYQNNEIVRLKIHKADCEQIKAMPGAIALQWRLQPRLNAVARLEITALAKDNLLLDILGHISNFRPHITVHKVNAIARNGTSRLNLTMEATEQALIDNLENSLRTLPNHAINEVHQMQLTFSEREELNKTTTPATFNPYRRQPVQDRDMFFGRADELAAIQALLSQNIGLVFVQGQKRVGKTSLLLYLKKHYLRHRPKVPVFIDFQLLGNLRDPNLFYQVATAIFQDLQTNNKIKNLEPPLRELFEADPARQFVAYLKQLQSQFSGKKMVLLIDEFSRTIDAYQQGRIDDTLFQQWRGIIQATAPEVSYVMVIQQQTHQNLHQSTAQDTLFPIWQLLELGEPMPLQPLNQKDAHQLIERPTYNHLEYSPQALEYVWRLTGGSPFIIQAFCFNLVRYMAQVNRRRVEWVDVESVQAEFMNPNEGTFAHLQHIIQMTPNATSICHSFAAGLEAPEATMSLDEAALRLPDFSREQIIATCQRLIEQYIFVEPQPQCWQFASLLFGRWLALNAIFA